MLKKKSKTTVQNLKKWQRVDKTIKYGKYFLPMIPAVAVTGYKWDEWFNASGFQLPWGLATMLIAIFYTLFSYYKEDNKQNQKYSPFFSVGLTLAIWGAVFFLLANILSQMALMFMFVVISVFISGGLDQYDKTTVQNRIQEYSGLVKEYDLDEKKRKAELEKEERRKKAQQEHDKMLEQEQESAVD